ncbi:putative flippase GtrA [Streptosporangium album]|uniref:Putative flippase GtrA n=1 Tax=Streptosporangium album TaxID=47479 RepID=A0A7W7RPF7_9ACTN|nr:GtrA family protein [Streptosporangium album]MBB4935769.1 putative flippase GtrA [Streptosporangium album]
MVEVESRAAGDKDSRSRWRALLSIFGDRRIIYLLAGVMTAAVYYALLGLGLFVTKDRVPYLFLLAACQFVTSVIVYPWYRLVVFRVSGESWITGYLRFYAVGLSFLAASVIGVPILVEFAGIPIMVAQGLIIAASPPLSYVTHRAWTFSDRGKV